MEPDVTLFLKDCPFCGDKAVITKTDWGNSIAGCMTENCPAEKGAYDFTTDEDAALHWNTRPEIKPDTPEQRNAYRLNICDCGERFATRHELNWHKANTCRRHPMHDAEPLDWPGGEIEKAAWYSGWAASVDHQKRRKAVCDPRELLAQAYQDNGEYGHAGYIRAGQDMTPDTQVALLAIKDALALATQPATSQEGEWVTVPREPTQDQLIAGNGMFHTGEVPLNIYRAMIAATPTPPTLSTPKE